MTAGDSHGPETEAFVRAFEGMLRDRGATELEFETARPHGAGCWTLGASLRLYVGADGLQDVALLAAPESVCSFARWLFGFPSDLMLDTPALLDALGETVNQLAGSIKETLLLSGRDDVTLDTPRVLSERACAMHVAIYEDSAGTLVRAPQWSGDVLLVAGPVMPAPLLYLDEAMAIFARFGDEPAGLSRAQRSLAEVSEALAERGELPAMQSTVEWCERQMLQLLNADSDAEPDETRRSRIANELLELRDALARLTAPPATNAFTLPQDEEMLELLREFSDEIHPLLTQARQAILHNGADLAHELFRCFHTVKGNAGFFGLDQIQHLAHSTESLLADARAAGGRLSRLQRDAVECSLEFIEEALGRLDDALEDGASAIPYCPEMDDHRQMLDHSRQSGEVLVIGSRGSRGTEAAASDSQDLRLRAEHLERLEGVEEKMGAIIARCAEEAVTPLELAGQLEQLRHALRSTCRSIRRVGLSRLFAKVARMARETAEGLNKLSEVEISGAHLDAPRHVVSALSGPMVHLVRNAVDHGIETPDERRHAGKPNVGRIEIRASRAKSQIIIEVVDDGRGISPERVLEKATRNGLVAPGTQLAEPEILELLMTPGFSTNEEANDISGRGVGMDVVRREVERVGGSLELTSRVGEGSCFRLVMPEDDLELGDRVVAAPADVVVADPEEEAANDDDFALGGSGELTFL
ncbi:MAG: hypothetical protein B7733_11975 [Myxococcales bacterium FL481]|nr:MAG: hypothetical protein B7733_11975 [Myxococcales bacterium FL481]